MKSPWEKLLSVARFTPSPHNVQPWKIKIINDQRAELFIDQSRTLPAEDITGSFLICAMGMFLEALRIICLNEKLKFGYELSHSDSNGALIHFATLSLEPNPAAVPIYSNEIFLKRRTSRLSSNPVSIPPEILEILSILAQRWGQTFTYINDAKKIEEIVDQNISAVFYDLNDPPYHDEIVEWFRYSSKEGLLKKDGLEARCMNMPVHEFYSSAQFPQLLKIPGIRRIMRQLYRKRIGKIFTIGLISGPFWKREEAVNTGAFLINFWLEMTKHNLFIHPFGNLVTNHSANQWLHEQTKLKNIWLVFRMGFTEPAPQSHRLDLEDILID